MQVLAMTPEMRVEARATFFALKRAVKDLNASIQMKNFSLIVESEGVLFPMDDYDDLRVQWLKGPEGAISDFVTKMNEKYQYFDASAYEGDVEDAGSKRAPNPRAYVSCEWRKVVLGFSGSIWIDLPLRGRVGDAEVCKWTRASFVPAERDPYTWKVYFDPTADECDFENPEWSLEYVNLMRTGGYHVDLETKKKGKKKESAA